MSRTIKHLFVYADGRVEESKTPLEGCHFIKMEMTPEGMWRREFDIESACRKDSTGKVPTDSPIALVALERSCVLTRTTAQLMLDDEEHRAKLLARVARALFEDAD